MKKLMFHLFVSTTLCLPLTGIAEEGQPEDGSPPMLEMVVVTGTRSEQKVEKIPAHVAIITEEQIKASGAQSVPDVLRILGGAAVRDLNGNGVNQSVDLGGFGITADRHVAVVIDGRRINPIDQSGVRWTSIPLENIERIEVLHGSGSVLYGDNAMGGVIHIITKRWDGEFGINAEAAAGSHDTRKGHGDLHVGTERFGIHLGFTNYQTDGYRDRSGSDRTTFYNRLTCDPTDYFSFHFELNWSMADFQFPGSLTEAQRDRNREQAVNMNDEGKDDDLSVLLGVEADWGDRGLWNLNFSRRLEDRVSDLASWWSFMTFDVETTGLTSQYILENPLAGHENRLTMGLDLYRTDYEAFRGVFKGERSNHFDHRRSTYAFYAQDEFNLLEDLLLNLGLRYEDNDTDLGAEVAGNRNDVESGEGEWALNLGLAYQFMPDSKVYGRVYRSFRFPSVDEYTSIFSGAINSDLKPETAVGYEAGARFFLFSRLIANFRAFWMNVDDEIAWNNLTNQNENLDQTRHLGGEMDFRYSLMKPLALYGGAGYNNTEFNAGENDGKKIPLIPAWKGHAGLEWQSGIGLLARLQYNYIGSRYFGSDNGNDQKKMKAYHTLDVYVSYKYKFMEIFFNGNNILDETYSDFAFYNVWDDTFNYYPMPEAMYYGGLRVRF